MKTLIEKSTIKKNYCVNQHIRAILFLRTQKNGSISDKTWKYFTRQCKNSTNFGKFYFHPKTHQRLNNAPGRPVISNCGKPTEKTSEFRDFISKRVMQNGTLYMKDSNDFISKVKNIDFPNDALLVIADVSVPYPSIPHGEGLKALECFREQKYKEITTENLIKMTEFLLKNNYFDFEISGCSTLCVYFYRST